MRLDRLVWLMSLLSAIMYNFNSLREFFKHIQAAADRWNKSYLTIRTEIKFWIRWIRSGVLGGDGMLSTRFGLNKELLSFRSR